MQFLNVITYKIPPQHRYPDHPPLMVKGVLVATKTMRTKTLYNDTRNEICLTANEILLRKVKSDKSDEISLREVADNRNAETFQNECQTTFFVTHFQVANRNCR